MENKKHFVGLTDEQVQESRKKYGNNLLAPSERDPLWKLFLEKFEDPIIRILLIAAFLSLIISVVHNCIFIFRLIIICFNYQKSSKLYLSLYTTREYLRISLQELLRCQAQEPLCFLELCK